MHGQGGAVSPGSGSVGGGGSPSIVTSERPPQQVYLSLRNYIAPLLALHNQIAPEENKIDEEDMVTADHIMRLQALIESRFARGAGDEEPRAQELLLSNELLYQKFQNQQLMERVRRLRRAQALASSTDEDTFALHERVKMQYTEVHALRSLLERQQRDLKEEKLRHARIEQRLQVRLRDVNEKLRLMRRENAVLLDKSGAMHTEALASRERLAELINELEIAKAQAARAREFETRASNQAILLAGTADRLAQWEARADVFVSRATIMQRQQAGLLQQKMEMEALEASAESLKTENRALRATIEERDARLRGLVQQVKAAEDSCSVLKTAFESSKKTSAATVASLTERYESMKEIVVGLESYIMTLHSKIERLRGDKGPASSSSSSGGTPGMPSNPEPTDQPAQQQQQPNLVK